MFKFLFLLFCFLSPHLASSIPKFDKYSYKCWDVYVTYDEENQKSCFIKTSPISRSGSYSKRGDSTLWVRYIKNNIDEVSITQGYLISEKEDLPNIFIYKARDCFSNKDISSCQEQCSSCVIDKCKNILSRADGGKCSGDIYSKGLVYESELAVVEDRQAWAIDMDTDNDIVNYMKSGYYAIVTSKSLKGTCSSDLYSLMGFTSAYDKMKSLCDK